MAALSWQPPKNDGGSNITGYRIYRSTTPGTDGQPIATVGSTTLSYRDDGLENGQVLNYQISAVNSVGEGELSNERLVTVSSLIGTPPDEIRLRSSYEDGVHTIHWSLPGDGGSPIKGFKVYGSFSSSEPKLIATLSPNVTEYQALDLTGLANPEDWNIPIYYWVVAYNEVGDGPMQSTPMTVPQKQTTTDYTWTIIIVGSVALVAVISSFLLIKRRKDGAMSGGRHSNWNNKPDVAIDVKHDVDGSSIEYRWFDVESSKRTIDNVESGI
jgi:hypothetical protein